MNKSAIKNVVAGQTLFVVEGHNVYQYPFVTTEMVRKRHQRSDVFRVIVLRGTTKKEYAIGSVWATYETARESIVKKLVHQEKKIHERHQIEIERQESNIRKAVDEFFASAREKIVMLHRIFEKSNDKQHTTP